MTAADSQRAGRRMAGAALLAGLLGGCSLAAGTDAESPAAPPYDLSQVQGIVHFPQDPVLREQLSRCGFAVVQREHLQIFSPYLDLEASIRGEGPLPPFVTVDSAFRAYQVILEHGMRLLERAQAARLRHLSQGLLRRLAELEATDERAVEAKDRLLAWAAVGLALQQGDVLPDGLTPRARGWAGEELERIGRGAPAIGLFASRDADPLGADPEGCTFPYGDLTPDGFYARESRLSGYWRAARWFGLAGFRLSEDAEWRCARLLSRALVRDEEIRRLHAAFGLALREMLGPPPHQDVSPLELPAAIDAGDRRAVRLLPLRSPWDRRLTEVFALREVVPSPLHVALAMGDPRAEHLLLRAPGPATAEGISIARGAGADLWREREESLYARGLEVLAGILEEPDGRAPPFCRNPAWRTKCTWTLLAGWTALRHAFDLHRKPEVVVYGVVRQRAGYVSPYPRVFEELADLTLRTEVWLDRHGALDESRLPEPGADDEDCLGGLPDAGAVRRNLQRFAGLCRSLGRIARKQIAREPLTPDERSLLADYGRTLGELHFAKEPLAPDDDMPFAVGFVRDATRRLPPLQISTAVGRALEIYVIRDAPAEVDVDPSTRQEITFPAGLQLYRGGVFSYYEVATPLEEGPLTDERWLRRIQDEGAPPVPEWAGEFLQPVRASPVDRLAAGEPIDADAFFGREKPHAAGSRAALEGYRRLREAGLDRDARYLLATHLELMPPEEAGSLVELAAGTEDLLALSSIAYAFARRAEPAAVRELQRRAPGGPPQLAPLVLATLDGSEGVERWRELLGDSHLGRWCLAVQLGRELGGSLDWDRFYWRQRESSLMAGEAEGDDSQDAGAAEDAEDAEDASLDEDPFDPACLAALRELALSDPDPLVRARAFRSLEGSRREFVLPLLREGLDDEHPLVRTLAALALLDYRDILSLPRIAGVLWYIDDPARRDEARRAGEAYHRREMALDLDGGRLWDDGPGVLLSTLFEVLYRNHPGWVTDFLARKMVEDAEEEPTGLWSYRLEAADKSRWRQL
ncbi:MAG: DUF3160 domain-containing protein, partial [Planctomycetes bacterium]|nr:DUF3160 domain-containing protein [Planctomycetota bacterium]